MFHIQEISCSDCDCRGPNLWLCLRENCGHIGCGEKSNDHNTKHNAVSGFDNYFCSYKSYDILKKSYV